PIISLLIDQEKNLIEFGITRGASISSLQTPNERQKRINDFGDGRYLLIWISPERFQDQEFRNCLQSANMNYMVSYAVIDEVHCLSEWGHDFRTSYLTLINTIRTYTPQVTLFGLTATASQAVLTDLKVEFGVDRSGVKATHSLGRENLSMKVRRTTDGHSKADIFEELISNELFANKNRLGIVFSATKESKKKEGCINLLSKVSNLRADLRADVFHASLKDDEKKSVQKRFMDDELDIMTATKAFGMGINKPNVRYTIHYGMPMSIESFYQEAGRAGRDDKPSDCYIIYEPEQPSRELDLLFMREVSDEELHSAQQAMNHDLNTIFFLWLSNNKGIENDVDEIMWFLTEYYSRYRQAESFDFYSADMRGISPKMRYSVKHRQADVERSLYQLKLLGVVSDWTIKQHEIRGQAILHIYISPFDEASVHKNFLEYIKKYDPLFEEAVRFVV
ncbi:ATP-dependent DNA helicase RecQ, partial [Candidatus Nomurabacteria bacterium]|nr:ATP-dependent DNA helicase RecQ [Candidatus Nomurabacteria bacterium]